MRGWAHTRLRHQAPEEVALAVGDRTAPDDVVGVVLRAVAGAPRPRIVIDGRSGAGKTTVAHLLAQHVSGAHVVSLDEFYPGWSGMAEATEITARLVAAHAAGQSATYRRWDWERDRWYADEHTVDPAGPLIIEGCGALSPRSARPSSVSVWIDGPAELRRARALARDGDVFAPYWRMWAAQEEAHLVAHSPRALADLSFDIA
ncbi:hypothetical protein [Microbacterium sp. G2-8]|uniref:hypothetical protein n=1 Tax=Microbacterium sp. G2-8 TaxID=2842454 RepID=UPI001C89797B|nr:hypothetical protein [Microbacterium sp. G2-8]